MTSVSAYAGSGATLSGSAIAWSSPGNGTTSNNSYASATIGGTAGNNSTNRLRLYTFGFSIPADATIDGIVVSIERKSSVTVKAKDSTVNLYNGTSNIGSSFASGSYWPGTDGTATYGSSTTIPGGGSLTPSDVNSANFGVTISANVADATDLTVYVDSVQITVYYTAPIAANTTETVAISDTPAATLQAPVTGTETVTVSDAQTAALATAGAATETVTVNHSASATSQRLAGTTETVSVSDSPSSVKATSSSVAESATVNDAPDATVQLGAWSLITETASVNDSPSATLQAVSARTESVTLNESPSAVKATSSSQAESLTGNHTQTALLTRYGVQAEPLTVNHAQSVILDAVGNTVESVTINSVSQVILNAIDSISDVVTLTEFASALLNIYADQAEQLTIADSNTTHLTYNAAIVESFTLSDSSTGVATGQLYRRNSDGQHVVLSSPGAGYTLLTSMPESLIGSVSWWRGLDMYGVTGSSTAHPTAEQTVEESALPTTSYDKITGTKPPADATRNVVTYGSSAPLNPVSGDIWNDTVKLIQWIYNGTSWIASATKNIVTNSTAAPSSPTFGDIWNDLSTYTTKVWNGSSWLATSTKNIVTVSTSAPASPTFGDIWFNTTTQQEAKWNGTSWQITGTRNVFTTSASAPTNPKVGDLWNDTNSLALKLYDGATWLTVITNYSNIGGTKPPLDATRNKLSIQSTAPASPSLGDIWYDTSVQQEKYYDGSTWQLAGTRNKTYTQASAPVSPALGDLWNDTSTQILKIYNGTTWDIVTNNYNTIGGTKPPPDATRNYFHGLLTSPPGSYQVGDFYYNTSTNLLMQATASGWKPAAGDNSITAFTIAPGAVSTTRGASGDITCPQDTVVQTEYPIAAVSNSKQRGTKFALILICNWLGLASDTTVIRRIIKRGVTTIADVQHDPMQFGRAQAVMIIDTGFPATAGFSYWTQAVQDGSMDAVCRSAFLALELRNDS